MKSDEFGNWSSKAKNAAARVVCAESDKPMPDGPPSDGPLSGPPSGPPSGLREPASSDSEVIDALPDADQDAHLH